MRLGRKATRIGAHAAVLVLTAALLAVAGPAPARAELLHPRQDWIRDSMTGLFIHWGMRTGPAHTDCDGWESAVTDSGWDARYWVAEAKKLHASYITFASFHSRLGYARAWPSDIPGSCSTDRDFLGELVSAANAQGLKVMLYMTDDPQWWWEGLPAGESWFDSAAYSAFKGRSVDLHTRDGFGEFAFDNFVEVMQRYPDLAGFWIDNNNTYWSRNLLRELIRETRPNWILTQNNEDLPIHDMVSHEEKTGMTPAYDYPQGIGTAMPRLAEADYRVAGHWWFQTSNPDPVVNIPANVGKYVTNAGASIKVLFGMGAQVNGRFPANLEAYNNFMNGFIGEIKESLELTEGGGYMYGGLKPGFWNDGAHGVTTVKKDNRNLQYIHVLTRPSGNTLKVRDNNYRVIRVTNVRTGARVRFIQSGGYLTIPGFLDWHPYDTVFRVETAGREGLHAGPVTAAATASRDGFPAQHMVDGDYLTWWDSNRTLPVSTTFDLGSATKVTSLAINQREWTPVRPRSGRNEQSAHIKDYQVYVSRDGIDWGSPIQTGQLPNHRGVQFLDLNVASTRYVRLDVLSTWAENPTMNHYRLLGVDEVWFVADNVRRPIDPWE
ncbi:MAG TPA: alpha-L-fucosidase [Pilimelia sp.]|nr:alpha-L-fucosidase [Pilimelia sp.]